MAEEKIKESIQEIITSLESTREEAMKAAKIYNEAVNDDPGNKEALVSFMEQRLRDETPETVEIMEGVLRDKPEAAAFLEEISKIRQRLQI